MAILKVNFKIDLNLEADFAARVKYFELQYHFSHHYHFYYHYCYYSQVEDDVVLLKSGRWRMLQHCHQT